MSEQKHKRYNSIMFICMSYFLSLILGCNILDVNKAESKKLVGNFYTIRYNLAPEDSGYYLILRKKSHRDTYLFKDYEYVEFIVGNDSLLLVKTKLDYLNKFYALKHINGDTILNKLTLSEKEFDSVKNLLTPKYQYDPSE